jgi:quinoprotein glucose dehydrogenase
VFTAGTEDNMFRAFDKDTGKIIWEYKLSAGGFVAPSTYQINEEQYLIIHATGGSSVRFTPATGDSLIAFKLKK